MRSAVAKLEVLGPNLLHPHQSNVQGANKLRELRPRAGRSRWRALYSRMEAETFLIAAIGPEAKHSKRGFTQAVRLAEKRIKEMK